MRQGPDRSVALTERTTLGHTMRPEQTLQSADNQKGGTDARRAESQKIMYKNGIGKDGAVSSPNGSSFNSRLAL